jgi:hypothetical protein
MTAIAQWFVAGGWPMYPVLLVGAMSMAVALRHAAMPGLGWASAASTLRMAALILGVGGLLLDVQAVAAAVQHAPGTMGGHAVVVGIGESLGPLVLAAGLAGLSALIASSGDLRDAAP